VSTILSLISPFSYSLLSFILYLISPFSYSLILHTFSNLPNSLSSAVLVSIPCLPSFHLFSIPPTIPYLLSLPATNAFIHLTSSDTTHPRLLLHHSNHLHDPISIPSFVSLLLFSPLTIQLSITLSPTLLLPVSCPISNLSSFPSPDLHPLTTQLPITLLQSLVQTSTSSAMTVLRVRALFAL
jgi:hypothetical protein